MKKTSLYKDILREIQKTAPRFLSILLMVALGSLIYVALNRTGPTMRDTIEAYVSEHRMYDMRISTPVGLDEEDRLVIDRLPGATEIEYSYFTDVTEKDLDRIVRIESLPDNISLIDLEKGRLPQKSDEILLDLDWMEKGVAIGDTVEFETKDDEDAPANLKHAAFTVVGFSHPSDSLFAVLKTQSATGGSIDHYAFALADAFDMEDISVARLRYADVAHLNSTEQEYRDAMDAHIEEAERAFETRPGIRLESIKDEAMDDIEENEQKLDDAKKELSDAEKKLIDARKELDDGYREYHDGKEEYATSIAEAEREIADGERELADAKKELDDGYAALREGEVEVADGKKKLEDARAELADAKKELDDGKKELEDGRTKLADAKKELDDGKQQLDDGQKTIDENSAKLVSEKDKLDDGREQIRRGLSQIEDGLAAIRGGREQAQAGIDQIDENLPSLDAGIAQIEGQLPGLRSDRADVAADLEDDPENPKLQAQLAQLDGTIRQLEGQLSELKGQRSSLRQQRAQLVSTVSDLNAKESELLRQRKEVQTTRTRLTTYSIAIDEGKEELKEAQNTLDEKKKEYEDGLVTYDESAADFAEAEKKYADGLAEYEDGLQTFREAEDEYQQGLQDLAEARAELADGRRKYEDGVREIADAKATLAREAAKGQQELDDAYQKLLDGEKEYADGVREYNEELPDAQEEIADGEKDLAHAKRIVMKLKLPKYDIGGRYNNDGYYNYVEGSYNMDLVCTVFPVLFFLIALLVSLTTMTRMVDEQRGLIGTYKALGYSNNDIVKKYMIYGGLSGLFGALLGIALSPLIVRVIYEAYSTETVFRDSPVMDNLYYRFSFATIAISLACTCLSAFISSRSSLRENAAELIRPKPPKTGNRIFLERITPLWSRLSFLQKVTARNIFRYKKRMFMTILGVAGCTSLVLMGFGIKDSVAGIIPTQYTHIERYDLISTYNENAKEEDLEDYFRLIDSSQIIEKKAAARIDKVTVQIPDQPRQEVTLLTPENPARFREMIDLKNPKTDDPVPFSDNGAVITQKLAILLELSVGDRFIILDSQGLRREVLVEGIAENYVGHSLYLTPTSYEKIFKEIPEENALYMTLNETEGEAKRELKDAILDQEAAYAIVDIATNKDDVSDMLQSLNTVVLVIILASSLLVVIVLYNLTNINISERIREISTIKVLGFYPKEVTAYIYRETYLLTLLGILIGFAGGRVLHLMIIRIFAPAQILMVQSMHWSRLLLAGGITLFFSIVVMFLMHRKMDRIVMIDALKSVE